MDNRKLYDYLMILGDTSMILGHRLSELCGHGPNLETDIALTNISLDLFGQVRNYFQYAATLNDEVESEDEIAFLRLSHEYRNVKLVEQPNSDFAYVIVRQYFYDVFHFHLLQQLKESNNKRISAIAHKSIKEISYHVRFSTEWMKRLGDGTEESHIRIQNAVNNLYPYAYGLMHETPLEKEMKDMGVGADLDAIKVLFKSQVESVMKEATIEVPEIQWFHSGGKGGNHTEYMGFILSNLQYMQRAYPNMEW